MAKLKIGDKMPDFIFNTAYEQKKTIGEVLNQKATFFWVLRYIGCTVCRYDVHLLANRYQEFVDKGSQVFIIMQSSPENVHEDLKETKLPFDIICDPDLEIYKMLEINPAINMQELGGSAILQLKEKGNAAKTAGFKHGKYEGIEEQLPAMFLVDGNGTVKYAHYATNIMDMPNIDEMLAML